MPPDGGNVGNVGVGVDVPPEDPASGGEAGKSGDASPSVWDWAKDEFGKAWTWTAGKAEEVWGKIKGGEGAGEAAVAAGEGVSTRDTRA